MHDDRDDGVAAEWFVESQRRQEERLTVGARVRVWLNECPFPHEPEEHGATGVIDSRITQEELDVDNATATTPDDVCTVEGIDHHVWSVTFDDPRRVPERSFPAPHWKDEELYHSSELEPLDPPADE